MISDKQKRTKIAIQRRGNGRISIQIKIPRLNYHQIIIPSCHHQRQRRRRRRRHHFMQRGKEIAHTFKNYHIMNYTKRQ